MPKILKNNTGSNVVIGDVGQSVPASGQLVIQPADYLLYADSVDVVTLINAATLTVNDGDTDLIAARGVDFMLYPDDAFNIRFNAPPERTNLLSKKNVQEAIEESFNIGNAAIFPIVLMHNGTVGNNTFYGYSNLLPGNNTPIIIPVTALFTGFTWSNTSSTADYTIEFRKNGTGVSTFYSVSRTNTKFFVDELPSSESFVAGDEIYVKHLDDGGNASDVGLVLFFKAVP